MQICFGPLRITQINLSQNVLTLKNEHKLKRTSHCGKSRQEHKILQNLKTEDIRPHRCKYAWDA